MLTCVSIYPGKNLRLVKTTVGFCFVNLGERIYQKVVSLLLFSFTSFSFYFFSTTIYCSSWKHFLTTDPPASETLILSGRFYEAKKKNTHTFACLWSLPGGLFSLGMLARSRLIKGQTTSWLLLWSATVGVFAGLMLGSLLLVSLCAGAAATFDSRLDVHWDLWKKTHEKEYQNEVFVIKKNKRRWM